MIVVVGAGLAGLQTVVAMRAQGYTGPLTLLGAEEEPPYDRPPLSKDLLADETDSTTLDADWSALDVDLQLATRAASVADHVLITDRGQVEFERLVLATGAEPRRLPGGQASGKRNGQASGKRNGQPSGLPGDGSALTLRTRADAIKLRDRLTPGSRLAIVGAGWIGAEVATAAVRRGVDVTVVEGLATPLAGALPPDVGARTLPWWADVDLRLGVMVAGVEQQAVHLAGGEEIPADTVLVAVGARPVAVAGVELTAAGAVAVDATLRSSAPDVFAVGDCASWESSRYGTRMLVEHWDNALHGPAVVATNVLGGADVWDPVPYFWSEQWGRMLQYAGHHPAGDRVVWRADGERWAAFWLNGERLVAALTVDRPRDLVQARRLMQRDAQVDPDRLADTATSVSSTER